MQELVIDGKTYISSKRAAEITGYAKDYVGQLCREGRVEARLVGRSWYVLEESIREHKFGENPSEREAPSIEATSIKDDVWSAPRYIKEEAPEMPVIQERIDRIEVKETVEVKESPEAAALSDMQAAWKEWFDRKQEEILEATEDQEAENEVEVSVTRTQETINKVESGNVGIDTPWSDVEEVVTIRRTHASMPFSEPTEEPVAPVQPRRERREVSHPAPTRRKKERPNLAAQALLIALASITVAGTLLATGHADRYIDPNWRENIIFEYLGGKSTLDK